MSEELARITGAWLVEHGELPVVKSADRRVIAAERRLNRALVSLQAGLEAKFIRMLKAKGKVPGTKWQREKLVDRVMKNALDGMLATLADQAVDSTNLGRKIATEQLSALGVTTSFTKVSRATQKKIRDKVYTFSKDTFDRIRGDFVQTLERFYNEGFGIDKIKVGLRKDFKNLRDYRLSTIARTEVQGTQNEATYETMQDYGVRYRQWLTAEDGRVRGAGPYDEYDHIHMHGQVVRIDENYSNGMKHPGDQTGALGDFINCRCRERPYIPSADEHILNTPYYP